MLIFLKLGGSLITDKSRAYTPRLETLARLSREIATARIEKPDLQLVIGHGSGSFGHVAGNKYGTRQGVHTAAEWLGFAEVWKDARQLNQIVVDSLTSAGLPLIAFPPSATTMTHDGEVSETFLMPLQAALNAGLVPLVNGDVVFDNNMGGTIISTEELFIYLAWVLKPARILLAGSEDGVWADYPAHTQLIPKIDHQSYAKYAPHLGGSAAIDVTGGMHKKVKQMLELAALVPELKACIFSGEMDGNIQRALLGDSPGTLVVN
jgi:isopentenyl phosphate kinase